jgi:hypothetical protein
MRYFGAKGTFWRVFSQFIRKRDTSKGYGRCISCGKVISYETCDAGHFIPANECFIGLLFDEKNVNAQCQKCNRFDGGNRYEYSLRLDEKYGEGTAKKLWQRKWEITKEKTDEEYKNLTKKYREKIKNLT